MFSLEQELKTRVKDPRFWDLIHHPYVRVKKKDDAIEDVYDGTLYPENLALGDFTTLGSSDGIKIFKTNKSDLWVVMLVLLELPPSVRYKQDNMIILGAWFGGKKPDFSCFFEPLTEQINSFGNGKMMMDPNGVMRNVSLRMLTMTADNQAKEALLNYQGTVCGICQQVPHFVENVAHVANVATFPFQVPPAVIRTGENILADAGQALLLHAPQHGIKGPSPLALVQGVDVVVPIDYQHNFCLRVMAKLLRLWFDQKHHAEPFSVRQRVGDFSRRMTDTKPPDFISRPPRSFEHVKFWKAVEFRSVLFYYGPLVLRDILPEVRYRHFLLLSEGLSIFCSQSISVQDQARGQQMLNIFVQRFPEIYSLRYLSKTVHSLCHVLLCVLKTGPLWATSCFPFESYYRRLKEMINGTRCVLHQLRHSVYTFRHFKVLSADYLTDHQKEYVRFLGVSLTSGEYDLERRPRATQVLQIRPHVFVLGKSTRALVTPVQAEQIREAAGVAPETLVRHFRRAFLNQETVMGITYRRSKKRNNAIVLYEQEEGQVRIGQVHSFHAILPGQGAENSLMAFLRPIEIVAGPFAQGNNEQEIDQLAGINRRFYQVLPPVSVF